MAKEWYIVHTYSGFEHKVKAALEERIKADRKDALFGQILPGLREAIRLWQSLLESSSLASL